MKLEVVQHQGARERWPKGAAPAGAPVAAALPRRPREGGRSGLSFRRALGPRAESGRQRAWVARD